MNSGVHQIALMRALQGELDPVQLAQPVMGADGPLAHLAREIKASLLAVAGRLDEARQLLGPWERQPRVPQTFVRTCWLAVRAETWARLGDPRACAELYAQVLPYADRMAISGLTTLMWPMSRSLALLARALGDTAAALRHAEHALRMAGELQADALVELIATEIAEIRRSPGAEADL
jgi:ATP/maltotriose-dependent transcriptional regulator MalT